MYASWSFVMFLFTLSVTLIYDFEMNKETVHLIIMGIMFFKLLVYYIVENIIAYRYFKFIFTPWLIYGLFLLDIMTYPGVEYKSPQMYETDGLGSVNTAVSEFSLIIITNVNFMLQICLLVFFLLLVLLKIIKFVHEEFFFQKKVIHSF